MIRRSNRPARSSAESRISGRLVAASTITPSLPVNPSISVRSWLRVCSRSSLEPLIATEDHLEAAAHKVEMETAERNAQVRERLSQMREHVSGQRQ